MIDTARARSLSSPMRWTALIALAMSTPLALASAQTDVVTSVPVPAPAPPTAPEHSTADLGPAQKNYVLASQPDGLVSQSEDNVAGPIKEKISLNKLISVPLIHDVQNDSQTRNTNNEAIDFELKYLNWGAVTQKQLQARWGHYFAITWKNDGPPGDFTACFEYRQVKSKEVVRTLTQKMSRVSGATRSYFAVVDKAYLAYGPVSSWRFTVRQGDTIVAETKSFIWQ